MRVLGDVSKLLIDIAGQRAAALKDAAEPRRNARRKTHRIRQIAAAQQKIGLE
jgi:hypothetical protein